MELPPVTLYTDYNNRFMFSFYINKCIKNFNFVNQGKMEIVLVFNEDRNNKFFNKKSFGINDYWKFGILYPDKQQPEPITRARMKEYLSMYSQWIIKPLYKNKIKNTNTTQTRHTNKCPDKVLSNIHHIRNDDLTINAWLCNPDTNEWITHKFDERTPHNYWIQDYKIEKPKPIYDNGCGDYW